ncbi:MAG: DEAD/DEAH box helicase family protein [Hyphomonadaceae bacterium]|nr:DEAD/DEAH box helicase family protein [Hyphomonadaceae bacterium]
MLPRFDQGNQSDETSDIWIASIGIDFQVAANASHDVDATPRFSLYVRVLPTWVELQDEALGLEIEFNLLPAAQHAINARVRRLRDEGFAREGVARPAWATLTPAQKTDVRARRAELQRAALVQAYSEQGITIQGRPDEFAEDASEVDADGEGQEQPQQQPDDHDARVRIGRLVQRGLDIPTAILAPAKLPGKWRRIDIVAPSLRFAANIERGALLERLDTYATSLRDAAREQVEAWLRSDEGAQLAWRDISVQPQDCRSERDWLVFWNRAGQIPVPIQRLLPHLDGLRIDVDRTVDLNDPDRVSIRVAIDNGSTALGKREAQTKSDTIFNVSLEVVVPMAAHRPLRLDRVEPSYRFRDFLTYDAIGLNCGVDRSRGAESITLRTTWAPSFVQPRIVPRGLDLPIQFGALADETFDVTGLRALPQAYREWIDEEERRLTTTVREGLQGEEADRESHRLRGDIAAQRNEAGFIERGIRLLEESQTAARALAGAEPTQRDQLRTRASPYRAWLLMNRSFFERDARDPARGWRLFQLAFVLAHIPTLASRLDTFRDYQDRQFDEERASLLYFPTGGGKSEAFYGTLLFAMFFDRLRGKDRGVTALLRYPLRLLTLQQGQRLLRLVAHAELVRKADSVGVWPLEIGFWVGGNNTPNRYAQVAPEVPQWGDLRNDSTLEEGVRGRSADDEKAAERYREFRAAYNKVPNCPICRSETGLRRYLAEGRTAYRLAITCFNEDCAWNRAHGRQEPLPFLLTDDTIYSRAPAIVLGTVDKLAMLGQHTSTIRQILGMFGLARGIGASGHLFSPRIEGDPRTTLQENEYEPAFPAFRDGRRVFHDPFPSLIIQDEAHLLEESLGTFSGLFDTLLDTTFRRIDAIAGDELGVARSWTGERYAGVRSPKIIAATATVSNPERQMDVLYQRRPLRFPYPGSDLYRSFFASPAQAPSRNAERLALERDAPRSAAPERTAPWMRLFVSIMTNGATHTVTAVAVLSAFHTVMGRCWRALLDENRRAEAVALLRDAQGDDEGAGWRRAAIDRAVAEHRLPEIAALLDLHLIALAYVTNKKGGDQVMDALDVAVQQRHRLAQEPFTSFASRLISGGIGMKEIQEVMELAEEANPGRPYLPLHERLRSIVATSAISHGVDVDRFNSMFFAGLPSDIAEYIQASSRVGRAHVGFVVLIPTPQSRRDRYVVETHDIFHRFLERMIAPPAVERWAENAIRRVLASVVQTWALLEENALFVQSADDAKARLASYEVTSPLVALTKADLTGFVATMGDFVLHALGYEGREGHGAPVYADVYRALIERELTNLGRNLRTLEGPMRMQQYWEDGATPLQPPMTSLRDVDEAGLITAGAYDALARGPRSVHVDDLMHVMRVIRQQRGAAGELDQDAAPGGA